MLNPHPPEKSKVFKAPELNIRTGKALILMLSFDLAANILLTEYK